MRHPIPHVFALSFLASVALSQQPDKVPTTGGFTIIGNSLVSAQQLFLGTPNTVYIIDKVEGNPTQINGHPAWASEWSLNKNNTQRPMEVRTNTFCAGGGVLGNGTWLNVGGNQAVTTNGDPAPAEFQQGGGVYDNADGRQSIRLLNPCDDASCEWSLSAQQSQQRWYPTLETLEDGSMIIIGGCINGGYVNDANQNNPTYEFFPPQGNAITLPVLQRTLPANLYPLTWLLPSGNLFIQSNWASVLYDYKTQQETPLDDIPDAVRTYPASAGSIMLPLTPANNWTATILFCGGSDIQADRWTQPDFIITTYPGSDSCVKITPDVSGSYVQDDPLPEIRVMTSLIQLPNGKVLCLNGAKMGTAGYGTDQPWTIGNSYADQPVLTPVIYDPSAPAGQRWSRDGLGSSIVPRMYHSSAILLPDGSVLVSGSNPNPDYVPPTGVYPTEYRTERFYPSYFNERRPQPTGLPTQLSYGGSSFVIGLNSDDLFGDVANIKDTKVVVIRTGFSTHAINMGQRYVELETAYTGYKNQTGTLYVNQLPPNPAILSPGPAMLYVVVKGVPSVGVQIMVGSGTIGTQSTLAVDTLPPSVISADAAGGSGGTDSSNPPNSGAPSAFAPSERWVSILMLTVIFFFIW